MNRSPFPHVPRRSRLARSGRVLVAACVFSTGILAAGALSKPIPAAPADCLPVVGCVTTTVPSLPLPPVTAPTLPTISTTTTASTPATASDSASTAETAPTASGAQPLPAETAGPQTALRAKAKIRVRGQGARRIVEIRLQLSKPARVSAVLSRRGITVARRQFDARAGSDVFVLRVGRVPKVGPARLWLTYRSNAGETARASYRLHLPR